MNKKTKIKPGGKKENKWDHYHAAPQTVLEKFLIDLIPEISKACGLCDLTYYVQTVSAEDLGHTERGSGTMLLSMNYVKEYKTVYLNITPSTQRMFDNGEKAMLARALVHELAHIITTELGDMARERVVTEEGLRACVEETTESVAQIARKLLEISNPTIYKL